MSALDGLQDRLRDLCMEYARQGSGGPGRWYDDVAALKREAVDAGHRSIAEAVDALPSSSGVSPYWVL